MDGCCSTAGNGNRRDRDGASVTARRSQPQRAGFFAGGGRRTAAGTAGDGTSDGAKGEVCTESAAGKPAAHPRKDSAGAAGAAGIGICPGGAAGNAGGAGSVIIGNISASSAVIAGAVKGDIDVQGPVVVDTSAVIMGNIKSRSVQINNGAVIEGFCSQTYADIDVQGLFEGK